MPTTITGSDNITSLDSKIVADLCAGYFYVDVTPSTFLAGGTSSSGGVQGANVKITNPLGVVIKQYSTSGFDINPPMTDIISVLIPKTAGVYLYGTYLIEVQLTDEDGEQYTISKNVNICPPDPKNKNKNSGCLNASLIGNCETGKVVVLLNNPPNYKGTQFTSQVNDLTLEYPTASGLPVKETTHASFSVQLYEGQYKLSGSVCVLYSYGDNVFYKIKYTVKCEKIIRCIIDECCVQAKLNELRLKLDSDCSSQERETTFSTLLEAVALFELAKLTAKCGDDPSDILDRLEELLGCQCTCNCNEGTPIIPQGSEQGFIYRGLLTQVTTGDPTAKVSDLNVVEIAWERTGAGNYIGTLSGTFTPLTADNTFIIIGLGLNALSPNTPFLIRAGYNSANSIIVVSTDIAGTPADSLMYNVPIELSIL